MSQRGTIPDWWRVFALGYIQHGNATEAYQKARPEVKRGSAETLAARLLGTVRFGSFLEEIRKPVTSAVELTRDTWLKELLETFTLKVHKINGGEKARLGEMLGRAYGWIKDDGPTLTNFNINVMNETRAKVVQEQKALPSLKEIEELSKADVTEG